MRCYGTSGAISGAISTAPSTALVQTYLAQIGDVSLPVLSQSFFYMPAAANPVTQMNYQRTLLVQRQEDLQQKLLITESMREKVAIDAELTFIEQALKEMESR